MGNRDGLDHFDSEKLANTAWLEKVASTEDSDLRGYRIALTYYHFARLLDEYIHGADAVWTTRSDRQNTVVPNANWFNFATWATVTINRDIFHRRPPMRSNSLVPLGLRHRIMPRLLHIETADGQLVSRALSWGQRLVFLSTTFAFLALREERKVGDEADSGASGTSGSPGAGTTTIPTPAEHGRAGAAGGKGGVRRFLPGRRVHDKGSGGDWTTPTAAAPTIPAPWEKEVIALTSWAGTEYVERRRHLTPIIEAFNKYGDAAEDYRLHRDTFPGDALRRTVHARRLFHANLILTAVEQDVVDAAVRTVVDYLPELGSAVVAGQVAEWAQRLADLPRQEAALHTESQLASPARTARALWARLMTRQLLVMSLPAETLRPGRDIPPLRPTEAYFPPELADLEHLPMASRHPATGAPADNAQERLHDETVALAQLVASFDRSHGAGVGSRARDWRNYNDRLNWAVTLLRSRQQDPTLFWAPYCVEDQQAIYEGRRPPHRRDPSSFNNVMAPLDPRTLVGR